MNLNLQQGNTIILFSNFKKLDKSSEYLSRFGDLMKERKGIN